MSSRTEIIYICDCCNKEVRYNANSSQYGGHPLNGWQRVTNINGSTQLSELNKSKEKDFCSVDCLLKGHTYNTK